MDNFLCPFPDLNPDLVTQYLQQRPEFLEDYVTNYVNTDTLERWLSRKSRHSGHVALRRRHDNHNSINSNATDVTQEGRCSSLSKWKVRELAYLVGRRVR